MHSRLYTSSAEFDTRIKQEFEATLNVCAQGKLTGWVNTPRDLCALVILLDQFPRHIYREEAEAFAQDHLCQEIVLKGLQEGVDMALWPVEQLFFYTPLMHSEQIELQHISIEKHLALVESASPHVDSRGTCLYVCPVPL